MLWGSSPALIPHVTAWHNTHSTEAAVPQCGVWRGAIEGWLVCVSLVWITLLEMITYFSICRDFVNECCWTALKKFEHGFCFIPAVSLQGVILWASKDPDERRKWLPVLCQKIDLSLLDSQTRLKYIATLEDRQLLTDDLKYIIAPIDVNSDTAEEGSDDQEETVKKTRYNSQEEVGFIITLNVIHCKHIAKKNNKKQTKALWFVLYFLCK